MLKNVRILPKVRLLKRSWRNRDGLWRVAVSCMILRRGSGPTDQAHRPSTHSFVVKLRFDFEADSTQTGGAGPLTRRTHTVPDNLTSEPSRVSSFR
jgi:hypothetical protein